METTTKPQTLKSRVLSGPSEHGPIMAAFAEHLRTAALLAGLDYRYENNRHILSGYGVTLVANQVRPQDLTIEFTGQYPLSLDHKLVEPTAGVGTEYRKLARPTARLTPGMTPEKAADELLATIPRVQKFLAAVEQANREQQEQLDLGRTNFATLQAAAPNLVSPGYNQGKYEATQVLDLRFHDPNGSAHNSRYGRGSGSVYRTAHLDLYGLPLDLAAKILATIQEHIHGAQA